MDSWIDTVVLVIFAVSIALGMWRGFFSALFGIGALLVGFLAAKQYALLLTPSLHNILGETPLVTGISHLLIFLIAFLFTSLLFLPCRHVLRDINLPGLNVIGGGAFGVVRALLYSALFVLALGALGFRSTPAWAQSHTIPYINTGIKAAFTLPALKQYRGYLLLDDREQHLAVNTPDQTEPSPPDQTGQPQPADKQQVQQYHDELDDITEELVRQSPAGNNIATELALQRYENEKKQTSQQAIVTIFEEILCDAGVQSSCPPEDE